MNTVAYVERHHHVRPLFRRAIGAVLLADSSFAAVILRVTLGAVLLPHGMQHLFGSFGGYGFSATVAWMASTLGVPPLLAAFAIIVEFVAPLLLIAGAATRLAAAALVGFMATAASTHLQNGFFMNWFGGLSAGAEGFEYHLLAIAMAAAVAITGAGAFSVDRTLAARLD